MADTERGEEQIPVSDTPDNTNTNGGHENGAEPSAQAPPIVRSARRVLLAEPPLPVPVGEVGRNGSEPVAAAVVEMPARPEAPPPPVPKPEPEPEPQTEAVPSQPDAEAETAAPATGLRARIGRSALWQSRGLFLGLIALGMALYGQKFVTRNTVSDPLDVPSAIRWYAGAIIVLIVGWLGTYKNKSFLLSPFKPAPASRRAKTEPLKRPRRFAPANPLAKPWSRVTRRVPHAAMVPRYLLTLAALALNLYSTAQLRANGYDSAIGGWGWAASLVLLLLAWIGHRPAARPPADSDRADIEDRTDTILPRWLEIGIVLAIFALGLWLRLHRLDDWTTGMHGDEGEAGDDALGILAAFSTPGGHPASPFLTGWFSQPNFYYWGIALSMKVFGTGMWGLRMFSALTGSLMILPFYPMVRQWFGVRMAIIASTLLAISDVAIHFSRQEFSNITTPFFLVLGFYFFFRGLRDRRLLNFVLAGYAHILSMYFYLGGRLTPILVVAFLVYLFLIMPLIRMPGVYRALRRTLPRLGRLRAAGRAFGAEARSVFLYTNQIIVYSIACICFVSPWLAYFVDHQAEWNGRANDKLILNNEGRMAGQYSVTHDPLYIGLRAPGPADTLPLPIVFEQTPNSIRLLPPPWQGAHPPKPTTTTTSRVLADGFWAKVMWDQLTTTLGIITYRGDASSVYTFANAPVAKPIEAVLIILGIAWALWRWRDTRMALLSLWFWSTVLIGGVLTIDAPYMARLVGIIPTLAVFAAIPVNKLCAEFVRVVGRMDQPISQKSLARLRRPALFISGTAVLALLLGLAYKNYDDYYNHYVVPYPFPEVTGQAYFVRQMNQQVAAEGRPPSELPQYYDLGAHLIYWGHGDNRFLNHGVPGHDMVNPANELPITDNGNRDAVFMVWSPNQQYLSVIKAYYPEGTESPFIYAPNGQGGPLFTSYRVTSDQLNARRVLRATYTPKTGPAIQRDEASLGTSTGSQPPQGLVYPVQATWTGSLVAPAFGRYHLHLDATGPGRLTIDGMSVLTATAGGPAPADVEYVLARGPHDVELSGTLAAANAHLSVSWAVGGQPMAAVPQRYLWSGPGKALLGEIRPLFGDPWGTLPPDLPGGSTPVTSRRIDGFLGFRDSPNALSNGAPMIASWTGTLTAPTDGSYQFEVFSNGGSIVSIDGNMVVDGRQNTGTASNAGGTAMLTAGPHRVEVRYTWSGNVGYLEAYWTPPGGQKTILGPDNMHADGGIWKPGTVTEPGNVQAQLGNEPTVTPPERTLDTAGQLNHPRGMAIDASGNIYVADGDNHRVAVFDHDGKLLRTWGKAGTGNGDFTTPEDVATGPDGKIYVLDSASQRVQVFTPDGKFELAFASGDLCSPAGFTVGADGAVYIADTCASRVRKYSADGKFVADFTGTDPATKLEQPVDVALGSDGALYIADLRQRIVKLDPATNTIKQTWPVQVGSALGAANIAMAGAVVYLTDPDHNSLAIIDTKTGRMDLTGTIGEEPGHFVMPTGVAVSPDGKIYVVNGEKSVIQVFGNLTPK